MRMWCEEEKSSHQRIRQLQKSIQRWQSRNLSKLPEKYRWNSNTKYWLNPINWKSVNAPDWLCHLLMLPAFRLKIFGDDAIGKVSACCKVGAAIVNLMLETCRSYNISIICTCQTSQWGDTQVCYYWTYQMHQWNQSVMQLFWKWRWRASFFRFRHMSNRTICWYIALGPRCCLREACMKSRGYLNHSNI